MPSASAAPEGEAPPPPGEEFELPPLPDLSSLAPASGASASSSTARKIELAPGEGKIHLNGKEQEQEQGRIELIRKGRLLLEALDLMPSASDSDSDSDSDSESPTPQEVVLGMDFGYTQPGAVVVVEVSPNGLLVVEEVVEPELPIDSPEGERSWALILQELADRYGATRVYTDPRDPEAVDRLQQAVGHLLEIEPIAIGVEEGLSILVNLTASGLWVHRNCS